MRPHPIAKCSKTLTSNASAAPLDVVKIKSVLKALGHYKAPEWGVSQYPDPALFAAIEKFQRAQGLKPDGIVKPDGATEAALSRALTPRRATTALQNTAQALQAMGRGGDELLAHITREEAALLHSVTDGATINPQTGLLEFWHDYESEAAGVGDYGENSGPDRDNDRGGDGQDQNTSDNTAGNDTTDNGDPPQNDPNNDGDDLGRGADDQDKSQDRARRASAKEGTLAGNRGFLDTTPDDDEDAQDWAPDLLGDDVSVPQAAPAADPNAPKDDKSNPAPKTDGGQKKGGLSLAGFFGNMAEDLGSIFSGKVTSLYSAYDVHNAKAMADKYGYFPKDTDRKAPWLRGGQYGPGGGSYSPSELHNAGVKAQASRNASPSTTGARGQNIGNPGALTHPKDNYMYWSEDEDLVDVPDVAIPDPQQENRQHTKYDAKRAWAEAISRAPVGNLISKDVVKSILAEEGPLQLEDRNARIRRDSYRVADGGLFYSDPNDPGFVHKSLDFITDIPDRLTNPKRNMWRDPSMTTLTPSEALRMARDALIVEAIDEASKMYPHIPGAKVGNTVAELMAKLLSDAIDPTPEMISEFGQRIAEIKRQEFLNRTYSGSEKKSKKEKAKLDRITTKGPVQKVRKTTPKPTRRPSQRVQISDGVLSLSKRFLDEVEQKSEKNWLRDRYEDDAQK